MGNGWCNFTWITFIQGHISCHLPCVIHSSADNLGHEYGDVLITLFHLHIFDIPFPCSSVVFSCDDLIARRTFSCRKVDVKIPVNCC